MLPSAVVTYWDVILLYRFDRIGELALSPLLDWYKTSLISSREDATAQLSFLQRFFYIIIDEFQCNQAQECSYPLLAF